MCVRMCVCSCASRIHVRVMKHLQVVVQPATSAVPTADASSDTCSRDAANILGSCARSCASDSSLLPVSGVAVPCVRRCPEDAQTAVG